MSLCESTGPGEGRPRPRNQSCRLRIGGRAETAVMGIVLLFTDQLGVRVADVIRRHLQQFAQRSRLGCVFQGAAK